MPAEPYDCIIFKNHFTPIELASKYQVTRRKWCRRRIKLRVCRKGINLDKHLTFNPF